MTGPKRSHGPGARVKRGTSLIEVLVVIVVFAVGMLAVVQIFPGGVRILALSKSSAMANALAQDELQRVIGRADQLPEQVLPVRYVHNGTRIVVTSDPARRIDDLGPMAATLDELGTIRDEQSRALGYWPLLSGANVIRRVVGEGARVPAPRQVGAHFGGLYVVQFGPILYNVDAEELLIVYGNDLLRIIGPPGETDQPQAGEYYVVDIDTPQAKIILPADDSRTRFYRLTLAYYTDSGTIKQKRDVVDSTITVEPIAGGGFYELPLSTGDTTNPDPLAIPPTETFLGVELDSVRLARQFEKIDNAVSFTDPYEYKLLDAELGLLLFSEQAHKTVEIRGGRALPLAARVNYDVLDWRNIRDEFRVPDGPVPQVKLAVSPLKIKGNADVDNLTYNGINVNVQNGAGATERRDIVLLDLDTGGVYLERTPLGAQLLRVDKSQGVVTFVDADGDETNGIQGQIVPPGETDPVTVNVVGRPVRALYQARNEWSVQLLKAPALYTQSSNGNPTIAEYYIVPGLDSLPALDPRRTRLYFPQSDAGRRVTTDEIWYRRADDSLALLENQSFVVQSQPPDPSGNAYIDVKSAAPDADVLDVETYGYAARGVKGASVAVRVLWNPATLYLGRDSDTNMEHLDQWGREWRKTVVESYVRRPQQ